MADAPSFTKRSRVEVGGSVRPAQGIYREEVVVWFKVWRTAVVVPGSGSGSCRKTAGRALLFQYVFPISILAQLLATTE
ncbi:hypothetical protein E2C01_069153 [Portunus trituberculatus]|uniref:Uncharacterized protein n=1 Tax=Portunus trituberculatus TaxID=210409 RepID=A0A5B7I1F2_PORTR|nr:hypothetical protein [Portunus trituberculatus]